MSRCFSFKLCLFFCRERNVRIHKRSAWINLINNSLIEKRINNHGEKPEKYLYIVSISILLVITILCEPEKLP